MIGVFPPAFMNVDKQTLPGLLVGSEIAGRELIKAMLRCLPPKTVGLFVPAPRLATTRQELARLADTEGGNYDSAPIWSITSLPEILQKEVMTAFHFVNRPQLHELSYVRSQFAKRPFPITCLTHGFSQQMFLWDFFARLLLTPTLACDSVVCTSHAARDAFSKILNQVRAGLEEVGCSGVKSELRLDIVPLGVDVEMFRPRDKQDTRRLLALPPNKTLILHFGRIDHVAKGDWKPLLLAFRELRGKYQDNVVLILAGASTTAR